VTADQRHNSGGFICGCTNFPFLIRKLPRSPFRDHVPVFPQVAYGNPFSQFLQWLIRNNIQTARPKKQEALEIR
jgi:hypothetical protein